jgi:1,5-anhydro-D-fructose reductase (1,5-anhydro-D-mannitol-forming)
MNFASLLKDDTIEITGNTGRISLSVFGNEPVRFESARGVESFDLPNPPHIQQPMIQTVVDDLLGRGTCASTGVSARRTNAVIDKILSGYYGGREDAFWTRPQTWPGRNAKL